MNSTRVIFATIACLVLFACSFQLTNAEPLKEVYKFTDENFYSYLIDNPQKRIFMKFYAPWCGHCKRMAEPYISVAEQNEDENIVYGEIDCTQSKVVCNEFDVKGYPTLLVIADGKYAKHTGKREPLHIVQSARNLETTEPINIVHPPSNDFISVLLRDLLEIWNIRRNALGVVILIGMTLGFIVHGGASKKK